jgi:hypothetical protein
MLKHLDSYRDKHEDVWVEIFLAFAKAYKTIYLEAAIQVSILSSSNASGIHPVSNTSL